MFGWLKANPIEDPQLGTLRHKGLGWRGSITLPRLGATELRIHGGRSGPDAAHLAAARQAVADFEACRADIEAAVFEHYEVYRDALSAQEWAEIGLPPLAAPGDVWPHLEPAWVLVETMIGTASRSPLVEVAFRTAWDIEHTLGARLQDGRLFELNSSV